MPPSFRSKVDAWLVAVLALSLAFPLVLAVALFRSTPEASVACLISAAFEAVLIALVAVPCRYVLETDHLFIRSGLLKWRIPYKEITSVALSRNPLSSPALSLDRVEIGHRGGFIRVSPLERDEFVGLLQRRLP